MERGFSVESDIHRDVKRNAMSHETLESHMQIRFGVESKEARDKCPTCATKKLIAQKDDQNKSEADMQAEKKSCRCHCDFSPISQELVNHCTSAWRAAKNSVEKDIEAPVANVASDDRLTRLAELRLALKKRATFYEPDNMKPVYETPAEKKRKKLAEKALEVKQKKTSKEEKKKSSSVGEGSSTAGTSTVYKIPKKSTTVAAGVKKVLTEQKVNPPANTADAALKKGSAKDKEKTSATGDAVLEEESFHQKESESSCYCRSCSKEYRE